MKYKWLNKDNNKNLIVFFNGWGMDEAVVSHLEPENYDILMFYDYNTLDCDFDIETLNTYEEKYLTAWSMGVMTATLFNIKYTKKIAINGTLKPIDNKFGIPNRIYDITIKLFSEESMYKFIQNMFLQKVNDISPERTLENQKSELIALKSYSADMNFKYDKIIISDDDKIIPTKNQTLFWNTKPNIHAGHAPFLLFKKWSELL